VNALRKGPEGDHVYVIAADKDGNGSINVTEFEALNTGTAHVQVTDFVITYANPADTTHVNVVKYVLPGSRVSWVVTQPPATGGTATIHGFSDHGEFNTAPIALSH
jgi:P pilus assembly chaperone PapD